MKKRILGVLILILIFPMLVYVLKFGFQIEFLSFLSNNHTAWAEFGTFLSGVYSPIIACIAAYIIFKQFVAQEINDFIINNEVRLNYSIETLIEELETDLTSGQLKQVVELVNTEGIHTNIFDTEKNLTYRDLILNLVHTQYYDLDKEDLDQAKYIRSISRLLFTLNDKLFLTTLAINECLSVLNNHSSDKAVLIKYMNLQQKTASLLGYDMAVSIEMMQLYFSMRINNSGELKFLPDIFVHYMDIT